MTLVVTEAEGLLSEERTALLLPWRHRSTRVKVLLAIGWACSLCLLVAAVVVGMDLGCWHGYVAQDGSCAYE